LLLALNGFRHQASEVGQPSAAAFMMAGTEAGPISGLVSGSCGF
jgi:hypothetical protein